MMEGVKRHATFDTSFWVHAFRTGLLPHLREQFVLHAPPAVAQELPDSNPGGREFRRLLREGEVHEIGPASLHLREFGAGERAAISVAIEHPDWVLLIDDRRAFEQAVRLGLDVLCSPVIVVRAYRDRTLTAEDALALLGNLAALGTLSPHLVTAALAMLGRPRGDTGGALNDNEPEHADGTPG
jgi:predicted nucleic acid-binding protein